MTSRLLVAGVHTIDEYPPAALAMCLAYAKQEFERNVNIEISGNLIRDEAELVNFLNVPKLQHEQRRVLLFSNYLWNSQINLRLSRLAKKIDPSSITIHGGPDAPTYTEAAKAFLLQERHVDFVVAGEGEETLKELLEALGTAENHERISIRGLRYLLRDEYVETSYRGRADDINKFPSPYLSGFFNNSATTAWQSATIETFRGCPYGCTFCDWGSVAGSKVKTFDLDRVFAEIEWVADQRINTIWVADSNFGILPRDVEIAAKICEIKARTGFPKGVVLTYAKNIKSRVIEIVELLANSGLTAQGIISLQTTDPETLRVIRRSNIKVSEYEKLLQAFSERNLPLCIELMLGLPGSTIRAFKNDLAYGFDLPVEIFVHRTSMLMNSPMAEPEYQREHGIEIDETNQVVSTKTFSKADIEVASTVCRVFQGAHRYGILRYLMRYLQWEKGVNPLDVIHDLVLDVAACSRYPLLTALVSNAQKASGMTTDLVTCLDSFRDDLREKSQWAELSEQFINWASQSYNLRADAAFTNLGIVQALLMPSSGRQFPEKISMMHNVIQWYEDWLNNSGSPLATYHDADLLIDDPWELSNIYYGDRTGSVPSYEWELDSALSRIRKTPLGTRFRSHTSA